MATASSVIYYVLLYFMELCSYLFVFFSLVVILKYTPSKMKDIQPILLLMMTFEFIFAICGGLGALPEYLYPLPVTKINGFFRLIGPKYGGSVAV